MIGRILRHMLFLPSRVRRMFPADAMASVEKAIGEGEQAHEGEILVVLESALALPALARGTTARERAREVFRERGVWDTEGNNGVLIYLLAADRDFVIVADRAIHAKVGDDGWERIAKLMEAELRAGRIVEGVVIGVREVSALLTQHFPGKSGRANQISDRPLVI